MHHWQVDFDAVVEPVLPPIQRETKILPAFSFEVVLWLLLLIWPFLWSGVLPFSVVLCEEESEGIIWKTNRKSEKKNPKAGNKDQRG